MHTSLGENVPLQSGVTPQWKVLLIMEIAILTFMHLSSLDSKHRQSDKTVSNPKDMDAFNLTCLQYAISVSAQTQP